MKICSIKQKLSLIVVALALLAANVSVSAQAKSNHSRATQSTSEVSTAYNTIEINGQTIFYREAGSRRNPTILLLHGFPTSSAMFEKLIPRLAGSYHVVAPDYVGFGFSSMPKADAFDYTFDNLANVVEKFVQKLDLKSYALYVQDYGAPIGFRLAVKHPERITALIVQNGNAYDEGLRDFWVPLKAYWKDKSEANAAKLRPFFELDATKWQYTHGTRNPKNINPNAWTLDQTLLDRAGNNDIQLQLFYSYGSNPPLYPSWQAYFRKYQPPTLVVWGKNDQIFPASGAAPYKRDLKNIEVHLLDTGHFALEEDGNLIAGYIRNFLTKQKIK